MSANARHIFAATVFLLGVRPELAVGQILNGQILELWSNRPVDRVFLTLVTEEGDSVASTQSDQDGIFEILAPRAGMFYVAARRVGYGMVVDGPVQLQDSVTVTVGIHIQQIALYELDPITITAEPAVRHLVTIGFYERQHRSAGGLFLGPDHIERRASARRVSDLLRGLPGVSVDQNDNVVLRGMMSGLGSCGSPTVFLDGIVSSVGNEDLKILDPLDVEAIEVYRRPNEIPAQYGGPTRGCGVILIWTRRGR